MKDATLKPMTTFRIYYYTNRGSKSHDEYIDGYSAQDAVDRIRRMDPDAEIVNVSKLVKGWK